MGADGQVWSVVLTLFLSCFYFQYLPPDLRHTSYLLHLSLVYPSTLSSSWSSCAPQLFSTCPLSLLQLILNQRPLQCVISLPLIPLTTYPLLSPLFSFFFFNFHIHSCYYLHIFPSSLHYLPILPLTLSYSRSASPQNFALPALLCIVSRYPRACIACSSIFLALLPPQ